MEENMMPDRVKHQPGYTAMIDPEGINLGAMAREAYDAGTLKPGKKCCGKCAFRAGSPERADPYAWLNLAQGLAEGRGVFLCHESVPGHRQQVPGTDLRVCAGFHALNDKPIATWMRLAGMRETDEIQ
jgi:hypothetical protein